MSRYFVINPFVSRFKCLPPFWEFKDFSRHLAELSSDSNPYRSIPVWCLYDSLSVDSSLDLRLVYRPAGWLPDMLDYWYNRLLVALECHSYV